MRRILCLTLLGNGEILEKGDSGLIYKNDEMKTKKYKASTTTTARHLCATHNQALREKKKQKKTTQQVIKLWDAW